MNELLDKIGFLLMPEQFVKLLPYCFWYWLVFFMIAFYIFRKR